MSVNSLTENFVPSILVDITKEKISPPKTPKNRLSRSYLKLRHNDTVSTAETQTLSVQINGTSKMNNVETNAFKGDAKELNFCPNCQVPFDILKTHPLLHTDWCTAFQDDLEECPQGEFCYSNIESHYQEYAHKYLAGLRALGKETERQELRTPSSSKKKQNGMDCSGSPLKTRKFTPESQMSPGYRKRLEFGNDSANTSSSDDLLCPSSMSRKINGTAETSHKLKERDSSADDIFRIPQTRRRPKHPPVSEVNDSPKQDNSRGARVGNVNKERPTEKSKTNILSENAGHSKKNLNNEICTLSKEKQAESEESDIQVIFERVPSAISTLHDAEPAENHTEQMKASNFSEITTVSYGYTSKAGIDFAEEQLLTEEFSKNFFEDEPESMSNHTPSVLPSSESQAFSIEVLPPDSLPYSPVNKATRSRASSNEFPPYSPVKKANTSHQAYSKEVLPSPTKRRKSKDIKPLASQNLITSYFQCNKAKSIEAPETTTASQSADQRPTIPEDSSTKQDKADATKKWMEIGLRLRKRGYSTLHVLSDDASVSSGQSSTAGFHKRERKSCPFYKKIPETTFVVDAFNYGIIPDVTVYFLSHFHYDHYGGLKKSFNQPIYCSEITAKLVNMKLGVDKKYLNILLLDEPKRIHGVLVTALDANHCPGSLMFLFQLPNGINYLHVGDFRADPKMESYPCFWNLTIDKLFLDTTYCEPRYKFPAQNEIIAKVVDLAKRHIKELTNTVFVCGSYTIGKEKIFTALAEALDCKIWAGSDKRRVLKCLQDPIITKRLTTEQAQARVHVCPMSQLNKNDLQQYMQQIQAMCSYLVAFIPTGWETKNCGPGDINMKVYGNITIYGVPYSEHSSFLELRRFVQFLRPLEIIPTVNMETKAKRAAMQRHFQQWLAESAISKTSGIQQKLGNYFRARE